MQRQDYPRPDAVRPRIRTLNGDWQFLAGAPKAGEEFSAAFDSVIRVPFPPGSRLSGVEKGYPEVSYRLSFPLSAFECSGSVILNFLGIDGAFAVYLNGTLLRSGIGKSSLHFDISALVHPGENVLTVFSAASPVTRGVTGDVWLEFAAKSYFSFIRPNAVYNAKAIYIQGSIAGENEGYKILAEVALDGKQIFRREYKALPSFTLHLPLERLPDMWNAGHPALYDIRLTLLTPSGGMADMIYTYAAFREIDVLDGKLYVNGRRTFLECVLDPMYYPDGISVPPNSGRIASDLAAASALGFNAVRFSSYPTPRHLYIMDKLGLFSVITLPDYKAGDGEYRSLILRDYGHPSIIMWEPVPEKDGAAAQKEIYADLRAVDPKRLVNFAFSDRIYSGDIYTFYCSVSEIPLYLSLRFNRHPLSEREETRLKKTDPAVLGAEKLRAMPACYAAMRAYLDKGDLVKEARYFEEYAALVGALRDSASGMELDSLYDTDISSDGLMDANRDFKISLAALKNIVKGKR